MELSVKPRKLCNFAKEKINTYIELSKISLREKRIARNFEIHDYTTEGNPAREIYPMREAIANFARKNGVKIDVYDSRTPVETTSNIKVSYADKNAHKNLHIVIRDLIGKKKQTKAKVLLADPELTYRRDTAKMIMVNVPGENIQAIRQVNSSSDEPFLRYFLRNIGDMVTETVNSRK